MRLKNARDTPNRLIQNAEPRSWPSADVKRMKQNGENKLLKIV